MMAIATREAYGKALAELIVEHDNVFVLDADLTKSTKTIDAKNACPQRHFNMGIAEGNMMSIAAGMAASNKVVYASSFAMFAAGRAYEQIRNSICYPNLNVKVCATHSGISVGEDGASHQCIEDIALMSAIPNMKVFQPCDAKQTKEIIKAIYNIDGPCFVRLGRLAVDQVYNDDYHFEFGKGTVLKKGCKAAIVASGLMVQECLKASELLDFDPTVIDIATIKPIDNQLIIETAKNHEIIITVEEHNLYGGLGSIVANVLAPLGLNCKHYLLGMNDVFGRSGAPKDLLEYYNLDALSIANYIKGKIK